MQIPDDALIARAKLTQYLLTPLTRNDKSKFLAQVGFTQANPEVLEQAIRVLAGRYAAVEDRRDQYGSFFRVEGMLTGPDGVLAVVTVWLRRSVDQTFYFVTLKPKRD